jgi:hypothetical protein
LTKYCRKHVGERTDQELKDKRTSFKNLVKLQGRLTSAQIVMKENVDKELKKRSVE